MADTLSTYLKKNVTMDDFKDPEKIKQLRDWSSEKDEKKQPLQSPDTLENIKGKICYQNVVFLTLLHYPLFLNFLFAYHDVKEGHIDKKGICGQRYMVKRTELPCRLCLFLDMAVSYWGQQKKKLQSAHWELSNRLLGVWDQGTRRAEEQDPDEFYEELIRQFKLDLLDHEYITIFDKIFQLRESTARFCRTLTMVNPIGRCDTVYNEQEELIVRAAVNANAEEETSEAVISKFFEYDDHHPKCGGCETNVIFEKKLLREPPEIFMVNASRMLLKADGTVGKIETPLVFGQHLRLKREVFDNRGATDGGHGDVVYKLFSALLHYGEGTGGAAISHYSVITKGGRNEWAKVSDYGVKLVKDPPEYMKRNKVKQAVQILVYHRTEINDRLALRVEKNKQGFVEGVTSTIPPAGETTLTWSNPENSQILERIIIPGVPWAAKSGPRFPQGRLHLPLDSPKGILTIVYRNDKKNVVESFTLQGSLKNNFDAKLKPGSTERVKWVGEKTDSDQEASRPDDSSSSDSDSDSDDEAEKTMAEAVKIKAEAEKIKAEAETLKAEGEKLKADAAKEKSEAEKAKLQGQQDLQEGLKMKAEAKKINADNLQIQADNQKLALGAQEERKKTDAKASKVTQAEIDKAKADSEKAQADADKARADAKKAATDLEQSKVDSRMLELKTLMELAIAMKNGAESSRALADEGKARAERKRRAPSPLDKGGIKKAESPKKKSPEKKKGGFRGAMSTFSSTFKTPAAKKKELLKKNLAASLLKQEETEAELAAVKAKLRDQDSDDEADKRKLEELKKNVERSDTMLAAANLFEGQISKEDKELKEKVARLKPGFWEDVAAAAKERQTKEGGALKRKAPEEGDLKRKDSAGSKRSKGSKGSKGSKEGKGDKKGK